ncbi:MAG: hypothetical protein AB7O26_20860 [Planctomycetaceae bacterium]
MSAGLDISDLPVELQQLIESEVVEGETIVWLGRPVAIRVAKPMFAIFAFGIPWTAFALFWMAGAAGFQWPQFNKAEDLFPLFGLPFVLVGLGMLSAPFWKLRNSRSSVYLITDRRAVIFEGLFKSHAIRSFEPSQLRRLARRQNQDGSGDIIFEERFSHMDDGQARAQDVGFHGLPADPGVKAVEDLLRELAATTNHEVIENP